VRLLALLVLLFGPVARTSANVPIWLIVGASDATPGGIVRKVKPLASAYAGGVIFQTRDCGDKSNLYGWAVELASSPDAAQAALVRLRSVIKDAYVKRCEVRPRSLLALNVPAVDPSIADVPVDAINWRDEDRVTSLVPLSDKYVLVVVRYFVNDPNDSLEGRRERVVLVGAPDETIVLMPDCADAGGASMRDTRIAFHCASMQAADNLVHSAFVFDTSGKRVSEVSYCRDPRWISDQVIQCAQESFAADGRLKLRAKRARLVPAGQP
jgi:hypothetical protein